MRVGWWEGEGDGGQEGDWLEGIEDRLDTLTKSDFF